MRGALLLWFCLVASGRAGDDCDLRGFLLPAPSFAIPLNTSEGFALLAKKATLQRSYWQLAPHFTTQATQSYCAMASAVAALNALPSIAAPVDETYAPYAYWTQKTLASAVEAVRDPAYGMSRDQLAAALAYAVPSLSVSNVSATAAWNASAAALRARVVAALGAGGASHVLCNFYRADLGEVGGGHWSPLAAYDPETDLALLLDVARYKYPPAWVPLADLAAAMVAPDPDNAGADKSRGILVVGAERA